MMKLRNSVTASIACIMFTFGLTIQGVASTASRFGFGVGDSGFDMSAMPQDPTFLERCIADNSTSELRLKLSGDPSVYSRTADFDGDGTEDVALIVSEETNAAIRGLLICRNGDSRLSAKLGPLFKPERTLTSFDDDNFMTEEWDVILKTESPKIALGPDGKSRIRNRNKGDVISFFHEGGAVFLFWDGKVFVAVEGG